nr:PREDICTED: uncharacterized protein LOC109038698 isoform X1 [Bemisia tabaci]
MHDRGHVRMDMVPFYLNASISFTAIPMNDAEATPQRLKEGVQHLKEWLAKQPHLPNVDDEEWLATFLCQCKLSLEKAKSKLDGYFSYRNKYPQLLKNRNPFAPEIAQARKAYTMAASTRLTKSSSRILHFRPNGDTSIYDVDAVIKRMFMIIDAAYLEHDRHFNYVIVFDLRTTNYTYFLKSLHRIPHMVDIFLNAYTERVVAFNVINGPPVVNLIVKTFKQYLPEKLAERVYVHEHVSDLLECKWVDPDVLSEDFGGNGPSLKEYDEFTASSLEKHAAWFAEQDFICSNEELRRKEDNDPEQLQGSFRKLEVD